MPVKEPSEQAAVVALLQTRPEGKSWADLTAEIVAVGSALTVWHKLVPGQLMDLPGHPNPLTVAASELQRWRSQHLQVLSILDKGTHAALRESTRRRRSYLLEGGS